MGGSTFPLLPDERKRWAGGLRRALARAELSGPQWRVMDWLINSSIMLGRVWLRSASREEFGRRCGLSASQVCDVINGRVRAARGHGETEAGVREVGLVELGMVYVPPADAARGGWLIQVLPYWPDWRCNWRCTEAEVAGWLAEADAMSGLVQGELEAVAGCFPDLKAMLALVSIDRAAVRAARAIDGAACRSGHGETVSGDARGARGAVVGDALGLVDGGQQRMRGVPTRLLQDGVDGDAPQGVRGGGWARGGSGDAGRSDATGLDGAMVDGLGEVKDAPQGCRAGRTVRAERRDSAAPNGEAVENGPETGVIRRRRISRKRASNWKEDLGRRKLGTSQITNLEGLGRTKREELKVRLDGDEREFCFAAQYIIGDLAWCKGAIGRAYGDGYLWRMRHRHEPSRDVAIAVFLELLTSGTPATKSIAAQAENLWVQFGGAGLDAHRLQSAPPKKVGNLLYTQR